MRRPKYTYAMEAQQEDGKWVEIVSHETRGFCSGYVCSHRSQQSPKIAVRAVRSDGYVAEESPADPDVSIGMIAGQPSPRQYRDAGERALETAKMMEHRGWNK